MSLRVFVGCVGIVSAGGSLPVVSRAAESAAAGRPDVVHGNLIQFNDNGAWSWFTDERAVVDAKRGTLILGSDACGDGVGGTNRAGDVEAMIYNLQTRQGERFVLKEGRSNPRAFV